MMILKLQMSECFDKWSLGLQGHWQSKKWNQIQSFPSIKVVDKIEITINLGIEQRIHGNGELKWKYHAK